MKEISGFHKNGKVDVGMRETPQGQKHRSRFLLEMGTRLVMLSLATGIGIAGWQCYTWQQTGTWPHLSLADALAAIHLDPAQIITGNNDSSVAIFCRILLDLPASVMVPLLTILLVAVISWFL